MQIDHGQLTRLRTFVLAWFMPLFMLRQFIHFVGIDLFGIPIASPFLLVGVLLACLSFPGCRNTRFRHFFSGFIIYSLFSGVFYLFHEAPFGAYVYDVVNFVLPMAFFFIGADERNTGWIFEKYYIASCLVCFLVGLYFYFSLSPWYVSHLKAAVRSSHLMWTDDASIGVLLRFSSFFGRSYAISYFGMSALCWSFLMLSFGKSRRTAMWSIVSIVIAWLSCILSQQRAAIASGTFVLVCLLVADAYFSKSIKVLQRVAIGAIVFILTINGFKSLFPERFAHFSERVSGRVETLVSGHAMEERKDQYVETLSRWNSLFLGYGLGSASAYAYTHGAGGAPDGNYVKLVYEEGLVGETWFLLLLAAIFVRGCRYFRYYRYEVCLLLCYCLTAIGSSSFCNGNGVFSVSVWYAVGRIWNLNELQARKVLFDSASL